MSGDDLFKLPPLKSLRFVISIPIEPSPPEGFNKTTEHEFSDYLKSMDPADAKLLKAAFEDLINERPSPDYTLRGRKVDFHIHREGRDVVLSGYFQ